jgi:hypothetical protein
MCAQRAVLPKTSQRYVPNVMSCPKLEMPKEQTRINPYLIGLLIVAHLIISEKSAVFT